MAKKEIKKAALKKKSKAIPKKKIAAIVVEVVEKKEEKDLGGRPSKYKSEYCDKILEFFNINHTKILFKTKVLKDGSVLNYDEEVAERLPTFERFAVDVGVHIDTLNEWTKNYEEFSEAYKKCKNLQKDMLNDLGMRGFYNAAYTQFVAKNITDMKDKTEVDSNSIVKTVYIDSTEKKGYEDHINDAIKE